MTIAPSTILEEISTSLIRDFSGACLPSSVVVPRTSAVVIAVTVIGIATARSRVSFLTPQMNSQLRNMSV